MATSGTYSYSTSAANIITDALMKCGGAEEGEDIPPEQLTGALRQLNRLIKWLVTRSGSWRHDEVVLFLSPNTSLYKLGSSAEDAEWCMEEDFISSTLSSAVSASATTLPVADTTGMTAGDRIGVELADKTRSWTTITSVDSSVQVTIPALPGAASSSATVYTYTVRPERPLKIRHARRRNMPTGSDIPIDIESQEFYRDQVDKNSSGTPIFITYKPTITSGRLEVWQVPSSVQMYLGMTVERPFEDITNSAQEVDLPQEWYDPIVWLLAERLEAEYRVIDQYRLGILKATAREMRQEVDNFDADDGSIYLQSSYHHG